MTLFFGADYYPEQWPQSRWETDAKLMKEAGFNVVRLAEFAWSRLEPSDGCFDFSWLDQAVDLLTEHGLKVVLGTPSASVPPWLFHAHPDMAIVDEDGTARTYGSRRDASPAHPAYCHYAVRIARHMAGHYAQHPHVIGWQVDNEFGDRCYSEASRRAFQVWLKNKYGTLENLNATWGSVFWSHLYTSWEHIPVPRKTTHAKHNPGLHYDYYCFQSELYTEFQQAQLEALREQVGFEHLITHNLMGFSYGNLDYFKLAAPLDFVSWDNYPSAFWREAVTANPAHIALGHSAMWGLKQQNFWVMEQQSGASGWHVMSPSPQPGQISLWAYQAIAHGADGIVFFRWRSYPKGAEQNWHGILDHHGQPGRRYHEVKKMGEQLGRLGPGIAGSLPEHQVAILHSYESRFSFQIQPDSPQFSYEAHVAAYYSALHRKNIPTALVSAPSDLTSYKLVLAPALRLVSEETVQHLGAYVRQGGVLVVTPRSGSRTMTNAIVETPLPGLLAELCGVTVEEYDALPSSMTRRLKFVGSESVVNSSLWSDVLAPTTAQILAVYDEGYVAGKPAITCNSVGQGRVIYIGAMGDGSFVQTIVDYVLSTVQVKPALKIPETPSVEVTERWQGEQQLIFVLNHGAESVTLPLEGSYLDLVSEEHLENHLTLDPYGVRILTQPPVAGLETRK